MEWHCIQKHCQYVYVLSSYFYIIEAGKGYLHQIDLPLSLQCGI